MPVRRVAAQHARKLNCLNCGPFGHNTLDCPEWAIPELTPEEEVCARHRHALEEQVEQLRLQRLKRERKEVQRAATTASETASQQVYETAADVANPYASCAEPTEPAGAMQKPADKPLKGRVGEMAGAVEEMAIEGHRAATAVGDSATTKDHCAATVEPQAPRTASQEVSEKTGDAENQNTECAWPTTAADSSQRPPDTPLKERAGHRAREVTREAEMAVAGEGGDVKDARGEGAGAGPDEGAEAENATSDVPATVSDGPGSGYKDVDHNFTPVDTCNKHKSQSTNEETYQIGESARSASHNGPPVTTNACARSASHDDPSATTDDDTSTTSIPPAVDADTRADEIRPPHTCAERPRPPDSADDEVQRTRVVEVEVVMSRGPDEVEVAADGCGDERGLRAATRLAGRSKRTHRAYPVATMTLVIGRRSLWKGRNASANERSDRCSRTHQVGLQAS